MQKIYLGNLVAIRRGRFTNAEISALELQENIPLRKVYSAVFISEKMIVALGTRLSDKTLIDGTLLWRMADNMEKRRNPSAFKIDPDFPCAITDVAVYREIAEKFRSYIERRYKAATTVALHFSEERYGIDRKQHGDIHAWLEVKNIRLLDRKRNPHCNVQFSARVVRRTDGKLVFGSRLPILENATSFFGEQKALRKAWATICSEYIARPEEKIEWRTNAERLSII